MTGVPARAVLVSLVLALAACSDDPTTSPEQERPRTTAASTAPAQPYTGYPSSIAVLGHSGATGEGSGGEPGVEVRANSWATGTNPDVRSVYLRLLAENPAVEDRAYNLAQAGADLSKIRAQAETLIADVPDVELVLVQAVDGDMRCPASEADLSFFENELTGVLDRLMTGLPRARIFLTNQDPTAPAKEARMLTRAGRQLLGGTGPCAFFDLTGRIVPRELTRLQRVITGYVERLGAVCDRYPRCAHDPAAFRFRADRSLRSPDLNHASVKGLALNAALAWKALGRTGLVPAE